MSRDQEKEYLKSVISDRMTGLTNDAIYLALVELADESARAMGPTKMKSAALVMASVAGDLARDSGKC